MEVREASAVYLPQQENSACPPGYKQTEVGVIPEDWDVVALGLLGSFSKGQGIRKNEASSGEIPCVRYGEIYTHHNDIVRSFNSKISKEVALTSKKIRKGDLLFAGSGETKEEIGKCVAFLGNEEAYAGGDIVILSPRGASSEFLGYLLNTPIIARQKASKGQGDAVVHISASALSSIKTPLPPTKAEQEAIAKALSDTDALIESLEQLVAKKRLIKQGAMQELLTGKRRLPGFSGEWEVERFGELAQIRTERVDPRRTGPYEFCIELEHMEQGTGRLIGHTVTSENSSLKTKFLENDVLFGKLRAYLKKYWIADKDGVCSTEIWALLAKPDLVLSEYLFQVVTGETFIDVASTAYGTHMPRSDWNIIKNYEINLPRLDEQAAIANVLGDMDAEIAALETRLAKAHQLKQGMMHELLTGRIRLIGAQVHRQADIDQITRKSHNWAFNEAVVIAVLAERFGKPDFPLGRKRYTKMAYLLHRKAEQNPEGYLKKAAGPYNPKTKYAGPEKIAQQNGYVEHVKNGQYAGFVAADNVRQAQDYFVKWYGIELLGWLEQFRFKKNDDLEVLATVDMAMQDLVKRGQEPSLSLLKALIASEPEWLPKLKRSAFSDANIESAMVLSRELFAPVPRNSE